MTEAVWSAGTEPRAMLEFLKGTASDRKLRLFAVSLARSAIDSPFDPVLTTALDAAERLADGRLPRAEQDRVTGLLNATARRLDAEYGPTVRDWPGDVLAAWLLVTATYHPAHIVWLREPTRIVYAIVSGPTQSRQPGLLREAFDNPFRPIVVHPGWLTSTVVSLSRAAYDDRAFDHLPVLADALQEAGCDHSDVLSHCRDEGVHVRGCWVVDMLSGKN